MIDQDAVTRLHRLAMKIAHEAAASQSAAEAKALYARAMASESAAAAHLESAYDIEPTRSILYRSAASLALQCEEYREAERLIARGLSGEPPSEIAEELRNLLERAHFERHLALKNVVLGDDEFQFSVAGQGQGRGVAGDGFLSRLRTAQAAFLRIAQELLGKSDEVRQRFKFFLVTAYPASFAITIKVGQDRQMLIDESLNPVPRIIDEFIECVDVFQAGDEARMLERLPDEDYRRDMMQLMHQLAPDGQEVALVGVARQREGEAKVAALTHRPQVSMPEKRKSLQDLEEELFLRPQYIVGQLLYANEMQADHKIILVDESGKRHHIRVREVSMEDIVKPLWGQRVQARVFRRKARDRFPELLDIIPA